MEAVTTKSRESAHTPDIGLWMRQLGVIQDAAENSERQSDGEVYSTLGHFITCIMRANNAAQDVRAAIEKAAAIRAATGGGE
jgi:hypothetical protein